MKMQLYGKWHDLPTRSCILYRTYLLSIIGDMEERHLATGLASYCQTLYRTCLHYILAHFLHLIFHLAVGL